MLPPPLMVGALMAQAKGLLALADATKQQLQQQGAFTGSTGGSAGAQWVSSAIQYFSEALELLAKGHSAAAPPEALAGGSSGGGGGVTMGGEGAGGAAGTGGVQGSDWWSGPAADLSEASLQYGLLCYQMIPTSQVKGGSQACILLVGPANVLMKPDFLPKVSGIVCITEAYIFKWE